MGKLTLSVKPEVVQQARELARENGTSVSSMFERFIQALAAGRGTERRVGPLTRKATGIISLSADESEGEVLEDALLEKYGLSE
jgi:hypothetical protein